MENIKTLNIGKRLQQQTPNTKQNCDLRSQNMNSKKGNEKQTAITHDNHEKVSNAVKNKTI